MNYNLNIALRQNLRNTMQNRRLTSNTPESDDLTCKHDNIKREGGFYVCQDCGLTLGDDITTLTDNIPFSGAVDEKQNAGTLWWCTNKQLRLRQLLCLSCCRFRNYIFLPALDVICQQVFLFQLTSLLLHPFFE